MEAYPIDFEPEQLARWFIAERQAAVSNSNSSPTVPRDARTFR
jgi:hypothetical protein